MIDILMFCFNDKWQDWEKTGFPMRSPIIARSFHQDVRIGRMIVVNGPTSIPVGLYRHLLHPPQIRPRTLQIYQGQLYLSERINNTLIVEQLRALPRETCNPLFYRFNCSLHDRDLIAFLRRKIKEFEMKNVVLWLNSPLAARFIGQFGELLSVYNAVDEWSLHPKFAPIKSLLEHSSAMIDKKADIVFAVSDRLVDAFSRGHARAILIPNGVDMAEYEMPDRPEPEDLFRIKHPRVGYVGFMQERFDVTLLGQIAERTPDISYVLAGEVFTPKHFEPLKKHQNIYFLGPKNKREVPAYIKGFDVCMMPHRIDEFTSAMNPIKLYEYLAAGKPTISTPVPGLDRFRGVVEFAHDAESFVHLINNALLDTRETRQSERIKFARANSWSNRVNEIIEIIDSSISETPANL